VGWVFVMMVWCHLSGDNSPGLVGKGILEIVGERVPAKIIGQRIPGPDEPT
jgi:hypothetical protein